MTAAGSAGTAADRYKLEPPVGRHRAPPTAPTPRAPAVIAVAAAVLTAASLTAIAGAAVAPDASEAASQVSTVTRVERTTAGPLEVPTVGVVAPAIESMYPTPSAPRHRTVAVSRGTRTSQTAPEAVSGPLVAITTPSEPTVTPASQPVTTTTADAPPPTTAAATSSATTSEETPTVESPTTTRHRHRQHVTVDETVTP